MSNLNIITSTEVELYIESFNHYDFGEIGSSGWLLRHKRLQELSQQAVIEASDYREEYVKNMFITLEKVPELVYEAISISVWRQKILPKLLDLRPEDCPTNLTVYIVLMHELTAANLLETVMFHSDSCVQLDDKIYDLLDYAAESVSVLISLVSSGYKMEGPLTTTAGLTNEEEFDYQKKHFQFQLGTLCTSILCYIVEHLPKLPVGVGARLVVAHDLPLMMAELISLQMWVKQDDKGWHKYINGKWKHVTGGDIIKVAPVEGQIWICLRQLLLDQSVMSYYDLSDFRRSRLSKVQRFLHDTFIDQLPPLCDLKHFLVTMSLTSQGEQSNRKAMLLEIVPEIKNDLLIKYRGKWNDIALKQAELLFRKDHEAMMDIAKTISGSYSNEALEFFDQQGETICGNCGKGASKKCSRCKGEWYCGRECQLQRWALHKDICDQLVKEFSVK